MYAGAYLYASTQNISPVDSAIFATEASAQIVTKSGPRLTIKEAQKLKEILNKKICSAKIIE